MSLVLLPVKDPARAKQRLASLLSPEERRRLIWAMLEDVSTALTEARRPDGVLVVSSCRRVQEWGRSQGWSVLEEEDQLSESRSVDRALAWLGRQGVAAVLRLPSDIPLLCAEDVDGLLAEPLEAPAAILVPSREGTGTNALLRSPPDAFPSRFGENSLELHLAEARRREVSTRVLRNPRIGLDLDCPGDLREFARRGAGSRTARLLARLDALGRSEHVAGPGA